MKINSQARESIESLVDQLLTPARGAWQGTSSDGPIWKAERTGELIPKITQETWQR